MPDPSLGERPHRIVGTFAEKENFPLCFAFDSGILTADECIDVVGSGVGR